MESPNYAEDIFFCFTIPVFLFRWRDSGKKFLSVFFPPRVAILAPWFSTNVQEADEIRLVLTGGEKRIPMDEQVGRQGVTED